MRITCLVFLSLSVFELPRSLMHGRNTLCMRMCTIVRLLITTMTELPEPLRVIEQNLLDCRISPIEVYEVPETSLTAEILDEFLGETPALQSIGLSAVYSPKRLLVSLAIASRSRVLLVKMKEKPSSQVLEDRKLLQDRILCNEHGTCHAFDIAPLAMALFHSHGIKISNGVDLQYVFREEAQSRNPNDAISAATRIRNYSVNRENVVRAFDSDVDDRKTTSWITHAAQRAWIASLLSTFTDLEDKLRDIPRVNTAKLSDEVRVVHFCETRSLG